MDIPDFPYSFDRFIRSHGLEGSDHLPCGECYNPPRLCYPELPALAKIYPGIEFSGAFLSEFRIHAWSLNARSTIDLKGQDTSEGFRNR